MGNGKEMVKMIDAVVGEVFFYNVNTGERLGTEALSTRECRKVARTNYINRKVAEALRAMREQRAIDERNALEKKSSTIINNWPKSTLYQSTMALTASPLLFINVFSTC